MKEKYCENSSLCLNLVIFHAAFFSLYFKGILYCVVYRFSPWSVFDISIVNKPFDVEHLECVS